jgi:hypothetical protein
VGNHKTVLKGGYVGRKGGSSFASLWFDRWLVWACKCAYDCAIGVTCPKKINTSYSKLSLKAPFVLLAIFTNVSITGTSTKTPTTVARVAPEFNPNRTIATATDNSKKLLAPIMAAGAMQ